MFRNWPILLIAAFQLQAQNFEDQSNIEYSSSESSCSLDSISNQFLLEAKAAYFRPTAHLFREIYGEGGIYGLEFSIQSWKNLYTWTSVSCFAKSGSSIGEHNKTNLIYVPICLGIKYLFPVKNWYFFLGAGAIAGYLHIHDHSPFVIQKVVKWGAGGIVKANALYNVSNHFFLDFFTDYSFLKIDFHKTNHGTVIRHHADLSGWSISAGLGVRF